MGKIEYFRINLKKQNVYYQPGETMVCSLDLRVIERLKINSINVVLHGHAKVRWSEHRSSGKSSYTVCYTENEDYLNSNTIFISKQEKQDLFLEPGDYSYPFEFILPQNIPSSFEHSIGKIHYTLKGNVSIPWSFDKHTIRSFTVITDVDLNKFSPSLNQPIEVTDSKNVLLSVGGPIEAKFSVKKGLFVPGEGIICSATIDNKCSRDIIRTSVKLVQELLFTGSSREVIVKLSKVKKCYRDVVCLNKNKRISDKTNEVVLDNQVIIIPPVCASLNDLCKIIQVNYLLIFSFGVFGSLDKDLVIPIKIGTIPLQNTCSNGSDSLPTYEECLFESNFKGEDALKGDMYESDEKTFRPIYPVFKLFV